MQVSQETGTVSGLVFLIIRIFQFVVIHTVKGFNVINGAEIEVFLEFPAFSMIQQMLAI